MAQNAFDRIFKNVPAEQKEELQRFRFTHPTKRLLVGELEWEYICSGSGPSLVILPGGMRQGEAAFRLILGLENSYRIIAPTYPAASKVVQWVDGLKAVLEAEGIQKANIFGTSAGGMLAQVFIRKYPQSVDHLIIGNTTLPDPVRGEKYKNRIWWLKLIPLGLFSSVMTKVMVPRMAATLPEDRREFWAAMLSELFVKNLERDWIVNSNLAGMDYLLNYIFQSDDLCDWDGKMLILDSNDDDTIGQKQLKRLKEIYPQAKGYTFHNAGHVPMITHEQEYIQLMRDFLST